MTNTIAFKQTNGYVPTFAEIGERALQGAVIIKKRAGLSLRKIVAIALFALTSFLTVGSSLNIALAKKIRDVKASGQFRLLNIYNSMKSANPAMIQAMNKATTGLASWYGGMFHGRKTAMGTKYNMYAMTAAHRSLPLGTWVKVTNERNGKSAIVQVTDRGPYVANRIMDLSYAAAQKLGYMSAGTTKITMTVLGRNPSLADASATAVPADSNRSIAAVTPAVFDGVSARSENVNLSSDNTTDAVSSLLTVVTNLSNGSAASAITQLFA